MRKILWLMLCLVAGEALARDKTDLITLVNGNQLNGEIKELGHGQLSFSTDSMGTVRVEWDDIAHAESQYEFEFELSDGTRYYGRVSGTEKPGYIAAVAGVQSIPLQMSQVVRMTPIENSFFEQVRGSLSVGANLTKAADIADNFNIGASATHRTRERSFKVKLSSIVTRQDGNTSERADITGQMTKFRGNRWFNNYFTGFERNDELALDLRTSIGAGFGRYFVQSNTSELLLLGGLVATSEDLHSNSNSVQSVEGVIGIAFSKYIYDHPNVDIDIALNAFPSFTQSGRYRAQLDARIRREIIDDLYIDLSLYATYDKDPQSADGKTTDHGIVTSLGWSF
jgi:hypothetical protein